MIFPIYNADDHGGLVSQEEAVILIRNRIKEALDLVTRIVPDPSNHRRAMILLAEFLEEEANHLRRQASTYQSPEPSNED